MRRREFIAGLGGAAAWPIAAWAQQPAMPVIGFLESGSPEKSPVAAFRQGLSESGYVEGRNLTIEYRFAAGQLDRLPAAAAELVRRQVAIIVTPGSTPAAKAAKAATSTIPIVFSLATDPVQMGLVASLNRPGGNATGYSEMNTEVGPKRFGLLHELVPQARRFGVLVNPKNVLTESAVKEAQSAAATIGRPIEVLTASFEDDIDTVFASLCENRSTHSWSHPMCYLSNASIRSQCWPLATQRRQYIGIPFFPKAGDL
jgi:putative tryptophan/tyrosine transport system substrate-binding protein